MKINITIRTLLIVFLLIHVDIQIAQGSDIIPYEAHYFPSFPNNSFVIWT